MGIETGIFFKLGMAVGAFLMLVFMIFVFGILDINREFGDVEYVPQDINHPLRPRSPYGASKCAARHIVKVYRESYNLFAMGASGPLNDDMGRSIANFVKKRYENFISWS